MFISRKLLFAILMLILSCRPAIVSWNPIPELLLHMAQSAEFPEAHAEVMLKKMEVLPFYDGSVSNAMGCKYLIMEQRKIYTSEGMEFANVQIPLYKHMVGFEIKGRTVHPDGSEVPLDMESVFTKTFEFQEYEVFTFPDVTPGSVVEFQYSYSLNHIHFLQPFSFQENIPVVRAEYKLIHPTHMDYIIAYHNKPADFKENSQMLGYMGEEYVIYSLVGDQLPPIRKEVFGPDDELQTTTVSATLEKLHNKEQVAAWKDILPFIGYNEEISACKTAREIVAENSKNKVETVYRWIQNNIHFNGRRGFSWSASKPQATLDRKSGDNEDLAVLLISMLRELDISAHPVLCRFRETGPIIKGLYSPYQFDHVIVRAVDGRKTYYLDPSLPFAQIDELYWNVQATEALLIESNKIHRFVTLPGTTSSDNTVTARHRFGNIESGTPKVKTTIELRGVQRSYLLEQLENTDNPAEILKNYLLGDDLLWHMDTYEVEDSKVTVEYTLDHFALATPERLIFNPMIYHRIPAGAVNNTDRKNDYWFGSPTKYVDRIMIDIPTTHVLETIPEDISITTGKQGMIYSTAYSQSTNEMTIERTFIIPDYRISIEQSDAVTEFFSDVMQIDGKQIILDKK